MFIAKEEIIKLRDNARLMINTAINSIPDQENGDFLKNTIHSLLTELKNKTTDKKLLAKIAARYFKLCQEPENEKYEKGWKVIVGKLEKLLVNEDNVAKNKEDEIIQNKIDEKKPDCRVLSEAKFRGRFEELKEKYKNDKLRTKESEQDLIELMALTSLILNEDLGAEIEASISDLEDIYNYVNVDLSSLINGDEISEVKQGDFMEDVSAAFANQDEQKIEETNYNRTVTFINNTNLLKGNQGVEQSRSPFSSPSPSSTPKKASGKSWIRRFFGIGGK